MNRVKYIHIVETMMVISTAFTAWAFIMGFTLSMLCGGINTLSMCILHYKEYNRAK